jgi:hypothetical protein
MWGATCDFLTASQNENHYQLDTKRLGFGCKHANLAMQAQSGRALPFTVW